MSSLQAVVRHSNDTLDNINFINDELDRLGINNNPQIDVSLGILSKSCSSKTTGARRRKHTKKAKKGGKKHKKTRKH